MKRRNWREKRRREGKSTDEKGKGPDTGEGKGGGEQEEKIVGGKGG